MHRRRDGRRRDAAGGGEDETLGDELAHQAAAAGPEREPQRHLRSSRGAAREQQVREVRAGDQQQDPDARHQRRQRPGQLGALVRRAAGRLGDLQALIEELGAAFPGCGRAVERDEVCLQHAVRPCLSLGERHAGLQPSEQVQPHRLVGRRIVKVVVRRGGRAAAGAAAPTGPGADRWSRRRILPA